MSLRGNPATLRELATRLRAVPIETAQRVAARVAPVISQKAQAAYDSGSTVYSEPRPAGKSGSLDLFVSGRTRGRVRFEAVGTVVRCVLGTPYARFLVGKYRILPMGAMPFAWSEAIGAAARDELGKAVAA